MTQAGGPAAINGFLYQILHHLAWIADIELTGKLAGEDVIDARLIFEPRDGGDACYESAGVRLVEQYKTRSEKTWSAKNVIEEVLKDLRKSVPEPYSNNEIYRFVTNGRAGQLDEFQYFCERLSSLNKEGKGPGQLDDQVQRKFFKKENNTKIPKTDRDLFQYIVTHTKPDQERPRTNEYATVFHLLAHFEMEFEVATETLGTKIEELLSLYVADLDDEEGKRNELVGILMNHLGKGETRLKVDELLKEAGLNPDRMRNLAKLGETTAALTYKNVKDWFKYDKEMDVKTGYDIDWPDDKPVFLITGESGSGKSWDLARLVISLGEKRQIAVLQQAISKDTADSLLKHAANKI